MWKEVKEEEPINEDPSGEESGPVTQVPTTGTGDASTRGESAGLLPLAFAALILLGMATGVRQTARSPRRLFPEWADAR
jgi:hypothetical protein